ncbi:hypothetical protein [Marmoricola sp. URHB0036]|uniref:hypothetical protein n=1 Tax=Marmoricola sp. URHB0036 TaxID=1298863 RepID=UPI0003F85FAC|nr:hypothetical protein [Marmoricola sp. URHB0036]
MPSPDPRDPVLLSLARAGGGALASLIRGVSALRVDAKPLHPRGIVVRGTLRRHGLDLPTGVAWLDEQGEDDVVLRWSRAVGLPSPVPDIHGLAVRVERADGFGDVLFATTGWVGPLRLVLVPGISAHRAMTTLLPYTTPEGALLLGARPGEDVTRLYVATPLGPWREFAELRESAGPPLDQPIRFDPVLHPLPGLAFPAWVKRLREPAYRTARETQHPQVTVSTGRSGHREDPR